MADICYPTGTDWSCFGPPEAIADLDPAIKERSEALAWSMLQALTGFRLSICPVVIRPCAARCDPRSYYIAPVEWEGAYSPYLMGGVWYNACGCVSANSCSCTALSEVFLPAEVGGIDSIILNGAVLDPDSYRVDNGKSLIRLDGEAWPLCQDMTASPDADGTFIVSYYPGVAPNDLTRYAAGLLAAEFYKACEGGECRLPTGVTNIARAGVTYTMEGVSFPGGMSGIPEVDAVIRIYNPNGLKGPSRVLSPDRLQGRTQTWRA
jgi:hypothetical protein